MHISPCKWILQLLCKGDWETAIAVGETNSFWSRGKVRRKECAEINLTSSSPKVKTSRKENKHKQVIINRHTSCYYGCLLHSALFHALKHLVLARIWVRTQDSMDQWHNRAWQFLRSCFVDRCSQPWVWFVCLLDLLPCSSLHIMTEEVSHQAATASLWQTRSYLGPGLSSQVASTKLQKQLMEQCRWENTEPITPPCTCLPPIFSLTLLLGSQEKNEMHQSIPPST